MSSERFTGSKVPTEDYGYDILSPRDSEALGDRALGNFGRMLAAPSAESVHEADVKMFPQEGIVVGPDINSENAIRVAHRHFDGKFSDDDKLSGESSISTSPEVPVSDREEA